MGEQIDSGRAPAEGAPWHRRHRGWLIAGAITAVLVVVVLVVWLWLLRTPLGVVAQAAVDTLARDTAATRVEATAGGLPLLGDVELVVAEGQVDFAAGTARFEREVIGGVATEIRYTPQGTFLQVPLTQDRWVALGGTDRPDGAATDAEPGDGPDAPLDVTQVAPGLGNPIALVALLRALEETPQQAGTEQVALGSNGDGDSVVVTRYRAVVDLEAAGDALTGDAADVVADLRRLTGGSRLPITVGVDDDGLIRLIRFEGTMPLVGPVVAQLETEIVFTGFDVPVDVEAPPPSRIVDVDASRLTELDPLGALRDLLGSAGG